MTIIQTTKALNPRKERDEYPTPYDFVYSVCNHDLYNLIHNSDYILDPGCGSGVWGKAIKAVRPHAFITGVEINQEHVMNMSRVYDEFNMVDFTDPHFYPHQQSDLIIGNPPYSLAHEFINKALQIVKPGGRVVFLLRLDFLASVKRYDMWYNTEGKPEIVRVSSSRISFDGSGKSDDTNYALFQWIKAPVTSSTILSWFDWKR